MLGRLEERKIPVHLDCSIMKWCCTCTTFVALLSTGRLTFCIDWVMQYFLMALLPIHICFFNVNCSLQKRKEKCWHIQEQGNTKQSITGKYNPAKAHYWSENAYLQNLSLGDSLACNLLDYCNCNCIPIVHSKLTCVLLTPTVRMKVMCDKGKKGS